MTELDIAPLGTDDLPPSRRRSGLKVLAAGLAVLVVVAGAATLAWWRSAPPELMPVGQIGLGAPVVVGHTYYTDAQLDVAPGADPASVLRDLRIDRISPLVGEDSAKTLVALLVCTRTPGAPGLGFGEHASLADSCDSVTPFTGAQQMRLGFQTVQVVVAVTPTQPGTTHIEGFEVTYAGTGRAVTTTSGLDLVLTAHP